MKGYKGTCRFLSGWLVAASGVKCPAWRGLSLCWGPGGQGTQPPFCDMSLQGPDAQGHLAFLGSQKVCCGPGSWTMGCAQTGKPQSPELPAPTGQQSAMLRSTQEAQGLGGITVSKQHHMGPSHSPAQAQQGDRRLACWGWKRACTNGHGPSKGRSMGGPLPRAGKPGPVRAGGSAQTSLCLGGVQGCLCPDLAGPHRFLLRSQWQGREG